MAGVSGRPGAGPLQDVLQPVPVDSFPGHPGSRPSALDLLNTQHDEHPDLMEAGKNGRETHSDDPAANNISTADSSPVVSPFNEPPCTSSSSSLLAKRCPKKTPSKDVKNSKKKMKDAKDDLEKARDRYKKLLQKAQAVLPVPAGGKDIELFETKTDWTAEEIEEFNGKASALFKDKAMVHCSTCGRSFMPDPYQKHLRNCKQNSKETK